MKRGALERKHFIDGMAPSLPETSTYPADEEQKIAAVANAGSLPPERQQVAEERVLPGGANMPVEQGQAGKPNIKDLITSSSAPKIAIESAKAVTTSKIKAEDLVKAQGGKKAINAQVKQATASMPKEVQKSIWDLTTQQKGAWLMDFGLRLMASSSQPGASTLGAIGQAGMGTIGAMRGQQAQEKAGALAAEQQTYDREQDRLKLEQGNKRIEASKASANKQYRATDTEVERGIQFNNVRKAFPKISEDQARFLANKVVYNKVLIRNLIGIPAKAVKDLKEEIAKNGKSFVDSKGKSVTLYKDQADKYFYDNPQELEKLKKEKVKDYLGDNAEFFDFAMTLKRSGLPNAKVAEVINQQTGGALPKATIDTVVKEAGKETNKEDPNGLF